MKRIVLQTSGAIGDTVIASALQLPLVAEGYNVGIISKPFALSLWKNLEKTIMYESELQVPPESTIVDLRDYLKYLPHTNKLPSDFEGHQRIGHLCEWMGYSLFQQEGIELPICRDDVRVILDKKEMDEGRNYVHKLNAEHNFKPLVVFAPYALTKNRNIPQRTLETVVRALKDEAICGQLSPIEEKQKIEHAIEVGDKDLRKAAAILLAANAYVGVDSGPLHMVNGTIQGITETLDGIFADQNKVIVVTGSSHPDAVAYENNRVLKSSSSCGIAPCGAHGYYPLKGYAQRFGRVFLPTLNEKDKSGCIVPGYVSHETAECMQIPAEQIIEEVRSVLKK